jgi:hypothetical protein
VWVEETIREWGQSVTQRKPNTVVPIPSRGLEGGLGVHLHVSWLKLITQHMFGFLIKNGGV